MSDKNPQSNKPVVEMTPEWLRKLLFKYGENEGILSGAHKRPESLPEPTEAFSNATTDISGIIASIDETLPADHQELSLSADWDNELNDDTGSSPAMDDLLASLREAGTDVDDLTAEMDAEASKDTAEETNVPAMGNTDWLFSDETKPTDNLPDKDKNEAEVPDWLTEFSALDEVNTEDLAEEGDEAPALEDDTPSTDVTEPDAANFDWLDELSDADEISIEDQNLPALAVDDLPIEDGADFSWLDDVTPTRSDDVVEITPEPPTMDSDEAWDADWLATVAQHYPADPAVKKPETPSLDEDNEADDFALTEIEAIDDENLVSDLPQIDETLPSLDAADEADDFALTEIEAIDDEDLVPDLPQIGAILPSLDEDNEADEFALTEIEAIGDENLVSDLPQIDATLPSLDEDNESDDFALTEIEAIDDENFVPDLPQVDGTEPEEMELSEPEPLTDAVPDWLSNLRDTATDDIETETGVETDKSSAEEDSPDLFAEMPDWLTEAQTLENDEIEADKTTSDDDLSEPHRPTLTDELQASTIPDWLNNLRETSEADTEVEADADIEDDERLAEGDMSALFSEMPDWLTEAQNVDAENLDTLLTTTDSPSVPEEPISSSDVPTETPAIPDWLNNVDDASEAEPDIEIEAETEVESNITEEDSTALFDEMPDWLIEAQDTEKNASESEETLFTSGDVPIVPEQPALADEALEDDAAIEPPTVPDWLSSLRETSASSEEPALEPDVDDGTDLSDTSALFDDMPDWLGEELSKETLEPDVETPLDDDAPQEQPALADEPWLMSGSGQASETDESKAIDLSALDFGDNDAEDIESSPDEVLFGDDFPDATDTLSAAKDDFTVDVPDWMKNLNLDEPDDFSFDDIEIDVPEAVQIPDDSEPFSLQEETVTDENVDEALESESLLSELQTIRDTQDIEPETEATFIPSDIEVDVPDDEPLSDVVDLPDGVQSTDEKAVAMEDARDFYGIVQPLPSTPTALEAPKKLSLFGKIMRAIFGLIFIALITIPLFSHFDRGGYPFPWLEPSSDMQGLIQLELQNVVGSQIPNNVALVAFDFTPATEGEMNPLATIVLKKLLGQGMRVVAVSLEPEGTGMIETVFNAVRTDATADLLVNAGYLSGGPIAIRAISAENALANLRDAQSGKPLSSISDWSDVTDFSDVDLLVDIAASADTARWWVEQNTDADMPRLAVVSAAAEPFVRPYRRSLQYDSLIAGINGAAALEASRRQPELSPATAMLDSQSVAHILIMILMLGGTIAGWIATYGRESD